MALQKTIWFNWTTGKTLYALVYSLNIRTCFNHRWRDFIPVYLGGPAVIDGDFYVPLVEGADSAQSNFKNHYSVTLGDGIHGNSPWDNGEHCLLIYEQQGESPDHTTDTLVGSRSLWIFNDVEVNAYDTFVDIIGTYDFVTQNNPTQILSDLINEVRSEFWDYFYRVEDGQGNMDGFIEALSRIYQKTLSASTAVTFPVMQARFDSAVRAGGIVSVTSGDDWDQFVDLGADFTGWDAVFAAKSDFSDAQYALGPLVCEWVDAALGRLKIPLRKAHTTIAAGRYRAEVELANADGSVYTPVQFTLVIRPGVIDDRSPA